MLKIYLQDSFFPSCLVFLVGMFLFVEGNAQFSSCTTGDFNICVDEIVGTPDLYKFYTTDVPEEDLVFWIFPDGQWGYHQSTAHFINQSSHPGEAHRVKKNNIDFSIAPVSGIPGASACASSCSNPFVGTNDLEISTSWAPAKTGWLFVILSFKSNTYVNETISLSYETNKGYELSEAIIPNGWANPTGESYSGFVKTLSWNYSGLQPNEQRHIYLKFNVAATAMQDCLITASGPMTINKLGKNIPVELRLLTQNYPHDPNFVRIETSTEPEYEEYIYCSSADSESDSEDDSEVNASEILTYTVGFHNDGEANSKDVKISINIEETGYELGALTQLLPNSLNLVENSHPNKLVTFHYDSAYGVIDVLFENINLPGLSDPLITHSYSETIGYITFEVQTQCGEDSSLPLNATIVFTDSEGNDVSPIITTNTVTASPGNSANCVDCLETPSTGEGTGTKGGKDGSTDDTASGKHNITSQEAISLVKVSPNPCSNYFILDYEIIAMKQSVEISLLDISGKTIKEILIDNQVEKGKHKIRTNTSDLKNGMYFISMKIGNQNKFYKLLKW